MAEVSVVLNPGVGGSSIAGYSDAGGKIHQEVVIQTQAGSSDPVSVSASNPLPTVATGPIPAGSAAIGTVAINAAIPTGANVIGGVTQSGTWLVQGNVPGAAADSGNGIKISGVYYTSPVTLINGQRGDIQADASGNLCVNIKAGAAAGGTSSSFSAALPSAGTAVGASNGTNMVPFLVDGSGNLKVNIVAGGMAAQQDNTVFTAGTSLTLPFSGLYNDAASNLTAGDAGIPRLTLARQVLVAPQANVNGGWSPYSVVAAASNNAASVKGSPGTLGFITAQNISANPVYVKFYNKATAPAPGTDTCVFQVMVPGNTAGAGIALPIPAGLSFTVGIAVAVTAGIALNDNTSVVTANQQVISLGYF